MTAGLRAVTQLASTPVTWRGSKRCHPPGCRFDFKVSAPKPVVSPSLKTTNLSFYQYRIPSHSPPISAVELVGPGPGEQERYRQPASTPPSIRPAQNISRRHLPGTCSRNSRRVPSTGNQDQRTFCRALTLPFDANPTSSNSRSQTASTGEQHRQPRILRPICPVPSR